MTPSTKVAKLEYETPPPQGQSPAPSRRKRVLLVEDYHGNIVVAVALLQSFGCDVVVANNGEEAIEKAQAEPFDIILMDAKMPAMDGYSATRALRAMQAEQKLPPVPIIGMTAGAWNGDREKCIHAGMNDYMSKPFTPEDLKHMLAKHIG